MRRLDSGDWGERPRPRAPLRPWLLAARHGAPAQLGAVVATSGVSVAVAADSPWRLGVAAVLVVGGLVSGEIREVIRGQFRRVRDARRLQAAFLELGIASRHRRLAPSVLGSAASPGATVVRVWLPVGLTVDDVAKRRHDLAEACFVDTVVVERRPGARNTIEVVLVHRTLGSPT